MKNCIVYMIEKQQ